MQEFIQFVLQNWFLWLLFFLILASIIWFETRTTVGGIKKLDPQSLVHLINHESATVIDLRESAGFKAGHIVNSVNLTQAQIAEKTKRLQKFKGKPVVLVCDKGLSAMKTAKDLKSQEFEKVFILNGGIAAWKAAGLPVEKQ